MFSKFDTLDKTIFAVNFLAFLLQIRMPEWQSSIMAFIIFSVILGVLFFETHKHYRVNKSLIDIWSKLLLYIVFIAVLRVKWSGISAVSNFQWLMLWISVLWLLIRNYVSMLKLDHKMYILLWIQNISITLWTVAYINSVQLYPR